MAKAKITAGGEPLSRRTKHTSGTKPAEAYPQNDPATEIERPALALTMHMPGTRLDMALAASHPLLLEIVRSLARTAAQAHHAATAAEASMPTQTATNKKDV